MKKDTQNLMLYQWETNLSTLKQKFQAIKQNKKPLTNKQSIQKLNNQHIKADPVLLRQFLQNYSKPEQLQTQATLSEVQSFFDLLKSEYFQVQANYIQISHDQPTQIELMTAKPTQLFEKNKTNLSKYIKDEPEVYRKTVERHLTKIKGAEDETGIPAQRIKEFLKQLLNQDQHIKVYQEKDVYFSREKYEERVQDVVKKYSIQVKQMPQNSFSLDQIYIAENEVLQFLTIWLKSFTTQPQLFIIYARTQQMLQKLQKQYLQSTQKVNNENENLITHQVEKRQINVQTVSEPKSSDITHKISNNLKPIVYKQQPKQQLPSQSILEPHRQQTSNQNHSSRLITNSLSRSLSKQEKLIKITPKLFTFASKTRTRIHKRTTFDEIQDQSQFINLQKFINFCKCLEINDLIPREHLIQQFKLSAINRLTLNLQRFGLLLKKLIESNKQVMNKLLNLEKLSLSKRKDKTNKFNQNIGTQLSKYNYKLRPVNGKDIESIQVELKEKKKAKQQTKKEKQSNFIKKKQGVFAKYKTIFENKGTREKLESLHEPSVTYRNPNQNSKKQIRKNQRNFSQRFNPASLISNQQQEDTLWDQYQSKIWKKDNNDRIQNLLNQQKNQTQHQSILWGALQKRIQRGTKVLFKIKSNLNLYS